MTDCLFCRIINKEIPSSIIYENEFILAFEDINPQAPVHILIIPKTHIKAPVNINSENSFIAGKLAEAASAIAEENSLGDYRLVMNSGEEAGQSVFHLHMHLLAGRKMGWPPG